jgi:hypothetical protein
MYPKSNGGRRRVEITCNRFRQLGGALASEFSFRVIPALFEVLHSSIFVLFRGHSPQIVSGGRQERIVKSADLVKDII